METALFKLTGVAGGTASGKTTVCEKIITQLHDQRVVLVHQCLLLPGAGRMTNHAELSPLNIAAVTNRCTKIRRAWNFHEQQVAHGPEILEIQGLTTACPYRGIMWNYLTCADIVFRNSCKRGGASDTKFALHGLPLPFVYLFIERAGGGGGDAFNTELLLSCMQNLVGGQAVDIPNYDYKIHKSIGSPRKLALLSSSLPLPVLDQNMVSYSRLFNGFPSADSDVRLARRIQRDTVERGRNIQNVLDQYAKFVKPSFEEFVLPSKKYADIVIPRGGDNNVAIDLIVQHIRSVYTGVVFCKQLCGVSVIRSGESMENALRACCKGIKIGKILIHGEGNSGRQLIYEKLPTDIASRQVLLLDPVLASGNSAIKAISLLLSKGVPESNIIFLNLISSPQGLHAVCKRFPMLKIVTSEIDQGLNKDLRVIPGMGEFGDRYFGTD
ncbi:hypothetical protein Ancab_026961 [Ancistrocladus abbreviatus]